MWNIAEQKRHQRRGMVAPVWPSRCGRTGATPPTKTSGGPDRTIADMPNKRAIEATMARLLGVRGAHPMGARHGEMGQRWPASGRNGHTPTRWAGARARPPAPDPNQARLPVQPKPRSCATGGVGVTRPRVQGQRGSHRRAAHLGVPSAQSSCEHDQASRGAETGQRRRLAPKDAALDKASRRAPRPSRPARRALSKSHAPHNQQPGRQGAR